MASSPLLFENSVIQLCDGEGPSYLLACDKDYGTELWRTKRNSSGCWSTPALVYVAEGDGFQYELVVNGTGSRDGSNGVVSAYDPIHGGMLWNVRGTSDIPIPSIMVGPQMVVSASGPSGPLFAIRPGGRGDVTETHMLWHYPSGGVEVATGVIYEDRAYCVSARGVVTCRDLNDGRPVWRKRIEGEFSASLIAGAGHVYATSEQGRMYVFEAADKFRLAERCLATPAIANGDLYVRTVGHLIRVGSTVPGQSRKEIALAE